LTDTLDHLSCNVNVERTCLKTRTTLDELVEGGPEVQGPAVFGDLLVRDEVQGLLDDLLRIAAIAGARPADRLGGYLLASFRAPNLERGLLSVWLHFWAALPFSSEVRHVHDETWTRYHMELYRLLNSACHDGQSRLAHRDLNQIALGVSALLDGLWLEWSLDHSRLDPEGRVEVGRRVEFVLRIDDGKTAQLLVDKPYDLFGLWHGFREPWQLYRSASNDAAPSTRT